MTRNRPLAILATSFVLAAVLAASAHAHQGMSMPTTGKAYDDPGGGDPNPTPGCKDAAHVVTIDGFSFSPASITINAGESVCWTWDTGGSPSHTVTADDGSFNTGSPASSGTFQVTFANAGTFGYYCQVHGSLTGGMRGSVVVNSTDGGGGDGGGGDSGPGTIQLSSASYEVTENAGPATIIVQRVGGHDGVVTVRLAVAPGSAKPGKDYLPKSALIKWNDGDGSDKPVPITIKNDSVAEPDETFSVHLSKPTRATLGTAAATVTIHDDDGGGCPTATAAPTALRASGVGPAEIGLEWTAGAVGTRALHVERRAESGSFRDVATLAPGATSFVDRDLPAGAAFVYRLRAEGADGIVAWSPPAAAATDGMRGACAGSATTLCLADGRFEATASWRSTADAPAQSAERESSSDRPGSGMFAFGKSDPAAGDLQLLLDVVDGCSANGHFWVFMAGVSDAETVVRVRDTVTGHTWVHYHAAGSAPAAVRDQEAFATCP